jgi:hypothetical protein
MISMFSVDNPGIRDLVMPSERKGPPASVRAGGDDLPAL